MDLNASEGARSAAEDLAGGRPVYWVVGIPGLDICGGCRQELSEYAVCPLCHEPVLPVRSLGCVAGAAGHAFADGYNLYVREHWRDYRARQRAEEIVLAASFLADAGEDGGALALLQRVLTSAPDNRSALAVKARVNAAAGDPTRSGAAELLLSAGLHLHSADAFDDAVHWLGKAIHLDPSRVEGYLHRARTFLRQGKLDLAAADYEAALARGPEDPYVEVDCREKIELIRSGDHPASQLRLRADYVIDHDPPAAMALYGEALRLNPRSYRTLLCRGRDNERVSNLAAAAADYEAALRLAPSDWESARHCVARLDYLRSGEVDAYPIRSKAREERARRRFAEAEALLARSLELNPRSGESYYERALLRIDTGDLAAAEQDCKEALRLAKDWDCRSKCQQLLPDILSREVLARPLREEGLSWQSRGKWPRALDAYNRAIEANPASYETLHRRARVRLRGKDRAGALADIEAALRHAPSGWGQREQLEELARTLKISE